MKRLRFVACVVIALGMTAAGSPPLRALGGQQAPAQSAQNPAVTTTLKLTVVISRFNGDKKVSNLPFVLMVVPGYDRDHSGDSMNLQMGAEVPVSLSTTTEPGKPSVVSWTYRSIGTSISSSARGANDVGQFSVNLTVTDSQLMSDAPDTSGGAPPRPGRFQNFTSSTRLLLRDGQTVQYTAATDKTSGEIAKLDVTMNVIK